MCAVRLKTENSKRSVFKDTVSAGRRFSDEMCHALVLLQEFRDNRDNYTDDGQRVSKDNRRNHQCADFT